MKSLYLEDYDCFVRYYVREGEGDPIVFIPGLITPAIPLFFDMINQPQLRDRPVMLINYPGTGISDHIDFEYHPRQLAEIIAIIINQEPILAPPFHIMGHSQGGTVGIYLAKLLGDRVLSLIISEGNLFAGGGPGTRQIASFTEQEWVEQEFDRMIHQWRQLGKEDNYYADLVAMQAQSHSVAIYRAAYQLVHLDEEVWQILCGLMLPRHFVYGEKNVPTTEEDAMPDTPLQSVLEAVGIRTHIVADAGHMMMMDNLEQYAKLIGRLAK